jgi:hypothetical protein
MQNPEDKTYLTVPEQRSLNQQLSNPKFKSAKEVAGWMGALQAQDYSMSKWALGIRIPNSTEDAIIREFDSGNIVRTHLLRPTWHIVSSDDIYWLLDLSAPRIKASLKSRDKQLGLTGSIYLKSKKIFERSLRDSNHKTRDELTKELCDAGIDIQENRASHLFLGAELDGIICSGRHKSGKTTYTILNDWIPRRKKLFREEALKELAKRYFTSHGPASTDDFIWWSGLTSGEAKRAIEFNKDHLQSEVIGNQTFWFTERKQEHKYNPVIIHLLPAYDEFLISYRNRTASLSSVDNKKAISNNGIFYPAIMENGQIIGTWKRLMKKDKVILSRNLFMKSDTDMEESVIKAISRYACFIGKTVDIQ